MRVAEHEREDDRGNYRSLLSLFVELECSLARKRIRLDIEYYRCPHCGCAYPPSPQRCVGRKLCAFSRYCLYRPCFTTVTTPTLRSTRRCLEAVGCVIFMRPTISLTVQCLPLFRSPIISRRFASAIALNTSVDVAALAMGLRSSRFALKDEGLPILRARGLRPVPSVWISNPRCTMFGVQPSTLTPSAT